jgi:hypothetical protein
VAFETTKQEIIKQAIALNTLWKQTRDQKYRDEELRLRRIALELENTVIGGTGVTSIIAGTGVTISPAGGTGNVTINATATTPDLQEVTDEGNTTTNAITVGGFTSNASSTIVGAAAGTIGTRVLTVEGSLPEIWFKDTFAATDSFVLSKYGSLFYFARTSSTGAFINYAGAISPSGARWSFGHGGNPTATVHIKGGDLLSSTKSLLVQNSSPTDLLTIWNDGAVGINTSTNAGYKLDVNGTIRGGVIYGSSYRLTAYPTHPLLYNSGSTIILQAPTSSGSFSLVPGVSGTTTLNYGSSAFNGAQNSFSISRTYSAAGGSGTAYGVKLDVTFNETGGSKNYVGYFANYIETSFLGTVGNLIQLQRDSLDKFIVNRNGQAFLPTLTNATHTSQVYYNTTTGELTYGAAGGGTTPTLDQVTTAGNTTTNAIAVGGLTVATNLIYTDTVNGRVGIGTTGLVPGILLTINGSVSIAAGQALKLDPSANIYMVAASSQFRVYTGAIAALSIANTGNVLINTTTDAGYKLDVNGTARVSGNLTVDTNTLFVDATNNRVGIGTTSPSALLTVAGDILVNDITVGRGGGNINGNVAVGSAALRDNTGVLNTAVGHRAIWKNANGGYANVAIGYQAFQNFNIYAGNNVVVGTTAGSADASGNPLTSLSQSILIGALSKPLLSGDSNEIVIGYAAEGIGSNSVVLGNDSITKTALKGNVLIGTTTDAGEKLQVSGDLRVVNGRVRISGAQLGLYATADLGLTINTGSGSSFLGYYATGDTGVVGTTVTLGRLSSVNLNAVSGLQEMVRITGNYAPTSGTGLFTALQLSNTINQTGGANGITRGLYINPTLTAAADFRAIQTTAGKIIHQGLTNATHADQVYYNSATGELTYGAAAGGSTPTLDQVTTAGNTTTNAITVDKLTINNGTYNASIGFGLINNPTANYFDVFFANNTGLRFGSPSFDGSAFQAFGGLHASYPGQIYFDYGSQQRTVANRSANFRNASSPSPVTVMKLTNTSNVLIGTSTDGGFKLDVNGTIRSNNVITASGGNSTDWNAAFGWGDHAAAGYITGTTGFTGVFTIPTNPSGQQNLDIQNGLIINVF